MGIDTDRDWAGGVLRASRKEEAENVAPREPWYRSVWLGRALAILLVLSALAALSVVLAKNLNLA